MSRRIGDQTLLFRRFAFYGANVFAVHLGEDLNGNEVRVDGDAAAIVRVAGVIADGNAGHVRSMTANAERPGRTKGARPWPGLLRTAGRAETGVTGQEAGGKAGLGHDLIGEHGMAGADARIKDDHGLTLTGGALCPGFVSVHVLTEKNRLGWAETSSAAGLTVFAR